MLCVAINLFDITSLQSFVTFSKFNPHPNPPTPWPQPSSVTDSWNPRRTLLEEKSPLCLNFSESDSCYIPRFTAVFLSGGEALKCLLVFSAALDAIFTCSVARIFKYSLALSLSLPCFFPSLSSSLLPPSLFLTLFLPLSSNCHKWKTLMRTAPPVSGLPIPEVISTPGPPDHLRVTVGGPLRWGFTAIQLATKNGESLRI